ncbi:Hit family protein 1 [Apiospora arundinis]
MSFLRPSLTSRSILKSTATTTATATATTPLRRSPIAFSKTRITPNLLPSCTRGISSSVTNKMAATHSDGNCIFCKIIKGDIPSFKLFDSDKTYAFLDIGPLSKGHCLVIPKYHGKTLQDIPDEHLGEILVVVKKLATATGSTDYNVLQNNGRIAHQVVDHVHFHMIPKPNEEEGLGVGWPTKPADMEELKKYCEEVKSKM